MFFLFQKHPLVCVIVLFAVVMGEAVQADAPKTNEMKKTVFIFDSYMRDATPFGGVANSLHERLTRRMRNEWPGQTARMGMALTLQAEPITPEGTIATFKKRMTNMNVVLVVTVGDPAAKLMAKVRNEAFPGVPVVMAACSATTTAQELKGSNTVILAQYLTVQPAISNILRVLPATTNIVVVMGNSPPEREMAVHFGHEGRAFANRVHLPLLRSFPFYQIEERCAKMPPRSAIFFMSMALDGAGFEYDYDFALRRILAAANAPVFTLYESQFGDRVVGGPSIPDTTLGENAADVAMRILKGEKPEDIVVPDSLIGPPVYDGRELARWGIRPNRLPTGSVIQFRQPTFWELYRWHIVGVMVLCSLQTVLIVGLLVNRAKRREEQAMATLIADLSSRFVNLPANQIDPEIQTAQRLVCESLGLDVSSLWQWQPDNPAMHTLTHYYRPLDGPPVPQTMKGQDYFPWLQRRVLAGEVIAISSLDDFPAEAARDREVFGVYGLKTSLTIPLSVGGGPIFGSVNFNDMRKERLWSRTLIQRLQLVAQIFANALARKVADEALRESEARLSLAADAATVGLWSLNLATARFWITDKTRELFNFSSGDELTLDRFLSLVHRDDQSMVSATIRAMVKGASEGQLQYRVVWPDGRVRWLLSRGRVRCGTSGEPECLTGVTIDITERKLAEEKLRQLSLVVEQSPASVVITDLQGSILYVNRKFTEVSGYSMAECLGQNPRILRSSESSPEMYRELWTTITKGQTWRGEFHNRRKNGELYWEWAVISPLLDENGKITHFVGIKEDITERKRTEQESDELRRELAHVMRVSTMGELAASLAHELNQPLAAIIANTDAAEILARRPNPDMAEIQNILDDVRRDGIRAGDTIHRIRAFLQRRESELQPVSVESIVRESVKFVEMDAMVRRIAVEYRCEPDMRPVLADRIQLQQVLINLIVNGMDAMSDAPQEQRRLSVNARQVSADMIELSVTDGGHGIPPEKIKQVFEPFFTTKSNGLGMGLAISRAIVEAHGGRLLLENGSSGGVIARFTVPIAGREVRR